MWDPLRPPEGGPPPPPLPSSPSAGWGRQQDSRCAGSLLTIKTKIPRNSARNSLMMACFRANFSLILVMLSCPMLSPGSGCCSPASTEQCCRVNPSNCPLDLGEESLRLLGAPGASNPLPSAAIPPTNHSTALWGRLKRCADSRLFS